MPKQPPADASKLELVVLHDQQVLLPDGSAITAQALPDHLKKTLRITSDTIILLRADTSVQKRVLADLARQLQEAGFPFAAPSGWIGQS